MFDATEIFRTLGQHKKGEHHRKNSHTTFGTSLTRHHCPVCRVILQARFLVRHQSNPDLALLRSRTPTDVPSLCSLIFFFYALYRMILALVAED